MTPRCARVRDGRPLYDALQRRDLQPRIIANWDVSPAVPPAVPPHVAVKPGPALSPRCVAHLPSPLRAPALALAPGRVELSCSLISSTVSFGVRRPCALCARRKALHPSAGRGSSVGDRAVSAPVDAPNYADDHSDRVPAMRLRLQRRPAVPRSRSGRSMRIIGHRWRASPLPPSSRPGRSGCAGANLIVREGVRALDRTHVRFATYAKCSPFADRQPPCASPEEVLTAPAGAGSRFSFRRVPLWTANRFEPACPACPSLHHHGRG